MIGPPEVALHTLMRAVVRRVLVVVVGHAGWIPEERVTTV